MNETTTQTKSEACCETPKENPQLSKDLKSLADEVRVKVHLAGMDLKDEFKKLEPQLDRAFSSAAIVSNEVLGDLKKRLTELKQRLTH
jgi:hypothetical protein